jgi:hypothetical protein
MSARNNPESVMTRLYELGFDDTPAPWFLGAPRPSIDSWPFRRGEPLEAPGELVVAIETPGTMLDVTWADTYFVVVTEATGALVEGLAPHDVQRIPVQVEGTGGRYELLHILTRVDAIDWDRTPASATDPETSRGIGGSLASLSHLVNHNNLYMHVMPGDMQLKADGIGDARIFRVNNWLLWPVVTEEIKDALQAHGVTGVSFRPRPTSL